MRQVCAQWALSKNEWIYEISSRRARYALKILLKLSPFNATSSCDRNEIDVHFRDWMVGREVPMSHHSKRGFAKRTPHESSQNLNFGCLHTHTQRESQHLERRGGKDVWMCSLGCAADFWKSHSQQWFEFVYERTRQSAFDHDAKFMIRLSQNYSTL